mmetsp:Transcript_10252/g.35836  ORF Transcript_10252/g.35836 Transcript_10252/m.35836 type:complete len:247 (+) Transcript_10252:543-1283(+)
MRHPQSIVSTWSTVCRHIADADAFVRRDKDEGLRGLLQLSQAVQQREPSARHKRHRPRRGACSQRPEHCPYRAALNPLRLHPRTIPLLEGEMQAIDDGHVGSCRGASLGHTGHAELKSTARCGDRPARAMRDADDVNRQAVEQVRRYRHDRHAHAACTESDASTLQLELQVSCLVVRSIDGSKVEPPGLNEVAGTRQRRYLSKYAGRHVGEHDARMRRSSRPVPQAAQPRCKVEAKLARAAANFDH